MRPVNYGITLGLIAVVIFAVLWASGYGVKTTVTLHATTPCAYPADFARKINMPTCAATIVKN